MTLADLTADDFARCVREPFTIGERALHLVLHEVEEFGPGGGSRNAFSLRFFGPLAPILPQAIYPLQNAALGTLDIFLVPLGPKDGFMRYEAIFT